MSILRNWLAPSWADLNLDDLNLDVQQLTAFPAQLLGPGPIDKSTQPIHVDAENAFAGGFEQLRQPVAPYRLRWQRQVVRCQ